MSKENYPPMNQWRSAEQKFQNLPLRKNEFTIVVNPKNGQAYHVVARKGDKILQTSYLDGGTFPAGLKKVSTLELTNREEKK
jgi:hypothetical protein